MAAIANDFAYFFTILLINICIYLIPVCEKEKSVINDEIKSPL